jgi:endonuclease YncB( thermonuclease family)
VKRSVVFVPMLLGFAAAIVSEPVDHDPILICQVESKINRVIDADTVNADVNLPWDVTLRNQTVRASDYDAWESTKRRRSVEVSDEEVEKGKLAIEEFKKLLAGSSAFYMVPAGKDVYGRLLAKWIIVKDGRIVNVAAWAEKNGHVRE